MALRANVGPRAEIGAGRVAPEGKPNPGMPFAPGQVVSGGRSMNRFNKFYAVSAIYLGLASAVGAQGSGAAANGASSGAVQASPSGQRSSSQSGPTERSPGRSGGQAAPERFEHPILERQSSTNMSPAKEGDRIQRRGESSGGYRDGDIRRNTGPSGSPDASGSR
jgi:hypothetical protein